MKETWINIRGYRDQYQVSNKGRVRNKLKNKIYSTTRCDTKGYNIVGLYDENGKRHTKKAHRLVAAAFIPNPGNKPQVNHMNCNKLDNRVSNLEWCTNRENMDHAMRNGLRVKKRGVNSEKSKITRVQLECARDLRRDFNVSYKQLGIIFNCCGTTIHKHLTKYIQN